MKRILFAGVLGLLSPGLLAFAQSVQSSTPIAPAPIAQRLATADVAVVGKVTSIEEKTVKAARFPGDKEKGDYQIAVVKIEDPIWGAQDLTHVRVGFLPQTGLPVRPGIGRLPTLAKDQEVCLFLSQHPDGTFYTLPTINGVIDKKTDANFENSVAEAKKGAKLLSDPKAGLESRDAGDRFLTAAMLILKYRTPKPGAAGPLKQEPIDAEESKKILLALADADWAPPKNPGPMQLTPPLMFSRLGLTQKDGWTQPRDFKDLPDAARKWLREHADTYRVQRYAAEHT
jgi:hypothetical protein